MELKWHVSINNNNNLRHMLHVCYYVSQTRRVLPWLLRHIAPWVGDGRFAVFCDCFERIITSTTQRHTTHTQEITATPTTIMRNTCFLAGCMAAASVLQGSPAGAFAPPSLIPPSRAAPMSTCRACDAKWSHRSKVERPHSAQIHSRGWTRGRTATRMSSTDIESPFATPGVADVDDDDDMDALLPLTLENVETVLDEMRPYLMSDG